MPVQFSSQPTIDLGFIKGLDGLRCIAILLVLCEHWLPHEITAHLPFSPGALGVNLFFVLSGFLIGRILIMQFQKMDEGKRKRRDVLFNFYARRSLRILPIYFLFLIFVGISGYKYFTANWPWLLTYTTNIPIVFGDADFGHLTHLWSLAVEEQFYIILPFLMALFHRRMPHLLGAFIAAGIACRTILYLMGYKHYGWFTISTFDYFGAGVFLAYLKIRQIEIPWRNLLLGTSFLLFAYFQSEFLHFRGRSLIGVIVPFLPIFYALLIDLVCSGKPEFMLAVLETPVFKYLGKISYGIYLYHYLMSDLWLHFLGPDGGSNWVFMFFLQLVSVILISALSFHFIEAPINRLKRHFSY